VTPTSQSENQLNVLHAFRRHKWKMAIVFTFVMAATVGYLFVAKPKFTSEAKLFVRLGKESVALDPTATTGQTVGVQESREKEIFSVQSLVQSRNVLERVVNKVGAARILGESDEETTDWLPVDLEYVKSLNPTYVNSPTDTAIEELEEGLEIYNPRGTAIVAVRYDAESPELAAEVLQELIDASVDAHVRVHRSEGSSTFFINQTDQLAVQVLDLEDELLNFKNDTGISELVQQRQTQIAQIATLEDSLLETTAQYEAVQGEIKARRQILEDQPSLMKLTETTGLPSSASQGMREQLYTLQLTEKERLARYQADHPKVKEIQAQIAEAKKTLQDEEQLKQITVGLNESYREMESALLNQQAIAASLSARKTALAGQVNEAHLALRAINKNEMQLAQITRRLDLARTNYQDYAQRAEQSRIDLALSDDSLSNLSVLQSPSLSKIPSSPKLALTLIIGATIGAFLSMLLAVYLQARDKTLYQPAQLDSLDMPLLGEVPHLPQSRILSNPAPPATVQAND
jgi:uncharacterized protein involved in exopolysaccharide biosynthesis